MEPGPSVTTAIVLAAGMGSRLMPLTATVPKVLVSVAGRPLLGRLLDTCAAAGIERAVVVTGYRHEAIERWLQHERHPLATSTVHNAAYDKLGNAWSLRVALAAVGAVGVVKLDGDLLLQAEILTDLVASPWPSAIALDRGAALDGEAMKATVDDQGRVLALGKWLTPTASTGESIGVEKIAAEDVLRVKAAIDEQVIGAEAKDAYYEDCYHALVQRGWTLGSRVVAERWWTEVDDQDDLRRAARLATAAEA